AEVRAAKSFLPPRHVEGFGPAFGLRSELSVHGRRGPWPREGLTIEAWLNSAAGPVRITVNDEWGEVLELTAATAPDAADSTRLNGG
ncbi:MAG: hypothetical protein KKC37_11525, partial [Proteobacteria bacterium]|nr:hypothetical protein [Pseudomonadota bacterium]